MIKDMTTKPKVRKYKTTTLYTIYKGKKQMYSHDETMPGVTIYFQNRYDPATTIVYCPNKSDAIEIIEYQENNKDAIHESQIALGNYIRKNKMY